MSSAIQAVLWMSGTLLSFALMAVAGRELSAELNTFQILLVRSFVGLIAISAIVLCLGRHHVVSHRPGLQVLRNTIHYAAQYGWFFGISAIPLAEVFAIEFTVPIWTAVLAAIFLGERLTVPRISAIALGFAGILIILRPGVEIVHPAALAVLAAAIGYGFNFVITKRLTAFDSALTILFYMNLVQFPLALFPALADWTTPSTALWPWMLAVGLSGMAAHYCISRALSVADAVLVVPLDFLRLPLIAVVGYLFYNEVLDPLVFVGALTVLAGTIINVRADGKVRPAIGQDGTG